MNVIIDSESLMPAMGFYADRPCFIKQKDGHHLTINPM